MKIIAIKFNKGYLISDNIENSLHRISYLGNFFFNGEKPEKTFKSDWFIIKEVPKIIEKEVLQPSINRRWELIDKSLSDKFKSIWLDSEIYDEDSEIMKEFQSIKGLYEYKEDKQPTVLQSVDFEWEQILEIETFNQPNGFSYKTAGQWQHVDYPKITEKSLKYDILSQIIIPPILLHEQPCQLSVQESYDIIRKYIQENINPRVSKITCDYDFCFAVKKKIPLSKPYSYQTDVNNSIFGGRKKKPKYETRWVKDKEVLVFEMSPKPYQSYTVIEPFKGNSQEDLKQNIDSYLEELINVINEPLCECDKCNGAGVLFNKIN